MKFSQLVSGLSKRQRALVYVAVMGVLLVLVDRVVYRPIASQFEGLDREIVLREQQVKANLRNLATRETSLAAYSAYASYELGGGSDEGEIASLLNEIEELGRKSGLSSVNIKPKAGSMKDFRREYRVEVEVRTEMVALVRFIHGLESSKSLIRVEQLRLVREASRSAQLKGYLLIKKTVIE